MFDEFLNPPPSFLSPVPAAATQRPADLTGSHVSTLIDQDAPSSSNPSTQEQEQSPIISRGVKNPQKHHTFMMIHFMKLFMKTRLLKDRHQKCAGIPHSIRTSCERVGVMSMGSLSCVGGGRGTLGGGEIGAFGDESWCFGDGVLVSS
ncbi:hypothetical protein Tco_1505530 [Tanacetum coccineum]